ncbi:phytoene desaturase family protein [Dactylosporangium darangshiense]|uniref:phytoene desaturase family protein n=1 Tax=Dactylosporangium darangshiense TaxID=579108 RepID=UPI00363DA082
MAADVIVVGAGHNGLTCAAYLVRAGLEVTVVESRGTVGGCASTVDAIGARVNICNCDHTMVLASGIVEELGLAAHGLRYLDVDPVEVAIGWGDEPAFVQYRSVERTVAGLPPAAGAAYRRYVDATLPLARLVLASAAGPPSFGRLLRLAKPRAAAMLLAWRRRSLLDVLASFGLPPWIRSAFAATGPGVWGVSPAAPGTAIGAVGPVLRHLAGVGRPAGGSGALPAALAAAVAAHGGTIRTASPVAGLVVEGGAVRGARLADGTQLTAPAVVCAVDPRTVLVDWLPPHLRRAARPRPDEYESKVDAVIAAPPALRALAGVDAEPHVATTVVSPPPEVLAAGPGRRVTDPPMFLVNVPSVRDPAMRPPGGGHLLSLEVLWTPYHLAGGWAGSDEPWRWLTRLASLAEPGFLDGVGAWRAMTPPDYERDFGLARGYAPSFAGGPLGALLGRPPELTRYRTAVRGLYLSGAGTFPGAGVWGASGRNAAHAVLADRR